MNGRNYIMNYLKHKFVIEDMDTGDKTFVSTFAGYLTLNKDEKEIAHTFMNCGDDFVCIGRLIARKQDSSELTR